MRLQWNDLLKTEQAGRMRAGLTDGSILSLGSNSELRVLQHDATSQQTSLEVGYGKLRSRAVKVTQPNGKFEVKTPNAVIGVIGTDFFVGYEPNKTTVICYTGVVTVTPIGNAKVVKNSGDNSSNNITLNAGQMVIISRYHSSRWISTRAGATVGCSGQHDGYKCPGRYARSSQGTVAPRAQCNYRSWRCRRWMGSRLHTVEAGPACAGSATRTMPAADSEVLSSSADGG